MTEPAHPVRLFAMDIDNTLLSDAGAAREFLVAWKERDAERRPLLVYNTETLSPS